MTTQQVNAMQQANALEQEAAEMKIKSRELFNAAGKLDRELRKLLAQAQAKRAEVALALVAEQATTQS